VTLFPVRIEGREGRIPSYKMCSIKQFVKVAPRLQPASCPAGSGRRDRRPRSRCRC
jgi:hypothetical protein